MCNYNSKKKKRNFYKYPIKIYVHWIKNTIQFEGGFKKMQFKQNLKNNKNKQVRLLILIFNRL